MAVRAATSPIIRVRDLVPALVIVVWFCVGALTENKARLARDCAVKDVAVLAQIEDQAEAGPLSAGQL